MITVKEFTQLAVCKTDTVRLWRAETCRIEFEGTYFDLAESQYADEIVDSVNPEKTESGEYVICINIG